MAKRAKHPEVPIEQLRWVLDPDRLGFETTDDLDPLDGIIGQKRGEEALRFGMGMGGKGYNIVVTGAARSGRLYTVKKLLEELSGSDGVPEDVCYVNNFKEPEHPILLRFAAGQGGAFKKAIQEFLDNLRRDVPEIFESAEYISRKKEIIEAQEKKTREFFTELEKKVKDSGFVLVNMKVGNTQRPEVVPVVDEEPVHMLNLEERVDKGRFPKEEFEALKKKQAVLKEEIDDIFVQVRDLHKEVKRKHEEVDRLLFLNAAQDLLEPVRQEYVDEKVARHLEAMLDHMADNLDALRRLGQQPMEGPAPGMFIMPPDADAVFHDYQVNLLVDNAERNGPPVLIESYPTYRNLFGSVERVMDRSGLWRTDFSKIKAGSFIKANGGYLVVNLTDAIMEPGVWQTLKRALKTEKIEIQTFDPFYFMTATGIKPEPIPMNVKVVVLTDPRLYHLLLHYDEDMEKVFKVRADFEQSMDKTDEAVGQLARFVKTTAVSHGLRPFHKSGVAALVEHAVRMAGRQEKVSTAFPQLEDILLEADYFAGRGEAAAVMGEHVEAALQARVYRASQVEDRLQEMIDRGSVFIDVEDATPGQVNGLAVYSMGDHMFGKPSRITAATAMGREGIVNIEREADMSGPTHNKGVLILAGYLRSRFAQDKPLTLAASIAFEQSYGGVDGDSASSTELYALLSSLSGVPIKQGVAVTGSVNQRGDVQPIGGVNEKIEGFYLTCAKLGLTGGQGVMIPQANVKDLMLKPEVVDAVREGRFHIWAVERVEQGIEILTGMPAGERGKNGAYPKDSLFGLVDAKLTAFAVGLKNFGDNDRKNNKKTGKAKAAPKT
ncbi:MAG: Lon protease family protein [Desulfovibrionaceae bacterium]